MNISEKIINIGVNDHNLDLFEGQYIVPNGMAYNSYLVIDEKIAVFDSVDAEFKDEWLNNISAQLGEKVPDYLIILHMEPDHSANILNFIKAYPNAKIVSNAKSFAMMEGFFVDIDLNDKKIVVAEGETLSLGEKTLEFISTPMVHWPEVMMCYEHSEKVLFSADAFGKFGANDVEEDWSCEARRYYFGIVGKYGLQVQSALKKVKAFDVQTICPLHGPVLNDNLGYYLDLYNTWSSYGVESEGIVIAYTSVYGNTKKAVEILAEKIESLGCPKVVVIDLARSDMAESVEDAFRYGKLILATTTYNGDIFPYMNTFIDSLVERNYQNRIVGFIENGTWAPLATKIMKEKLSHSKNLTLLTSEVKIKSSVNAQNIQQIDDMAEEIMA